MKKTPKTIEILLLCAALLFVCGAFAYSAARILPQQPPRAVPARAAAMRAQKEADAAPEQGTTAFPPPEETAGPAETTAPRETSGLPRETTETPQTSAEGTLPQTTRDGSVMDLRPTEATTAAPADSGYLTIDRYRIADAKVLPIRANDVVSDRLASKTDIRAYPFTADERGVMQIGFHYDVAELPGVPWIVSLYEAYSVNGTDKADAWRLLTRLNVTSTEAAVVKSEKVGLYPGEYAIVVSVGDVYSAADFTLMAAFITNAPWEAEPNDTKTRYNELSPGVRTGGSSGNGMAADRDWYLIELPADGYVSFLFEHEKLGGYSVGWFLTLRNENGEIFWRQRSYQQDAETTSGEIGLPAGHYYLVVEAHIRQDADYYITCTIGAADDFETERNDTRGTADEIALTDRTVRIRGSLSEKDGTPDADWHRFVLAEDGVVSFTFQHKDLLRPRDGWRIRLTDADGANIYRMNSRWADPVVTSPQIGLSAGAYYFCVDGEDMLYTNETYAVDLTHAAGKNWESENNDVIERADPLTPGAIRYGTLVSSGLDFDTDFYTFTLEKTAAVTVTLSHNTLSGSGEGWLVTLLDAQGTPLTSFASQWETRNVNSPLLNLSPGAYYVRVSTGTKFSEVRYGVTVNLK